MKKESTIKRGDEVVGTRAQETQQIRSAFVPESFNSNDLTVEVVMASDSNVRRATWDGPIIEVLQCDASAVRTDRLDAGMSVLNNHERWGDVSEVVVGVVDSYRFEDGKMIGKIRLSKRKDNEGLVQDIKDGIIRHLSIGYDVLEYQITEKEGQTTIYRAVDWEPKEVSFVPVPADAASTVRSEENKININKSNKAMPQNRSAEETAPVTEAVPVAEQTATTEAATETAPTVEAPTATATAEGAERSATQIIEAVRSAGLGNDVAIDFITRGISIDNARAEIITKMKDNQNQNDTRSNASVGGDRSAEKFRAMEDALAFRSGAVSKLEDNARDFAGMSLVRMAEEALTTQGIQTRGMSQREIASTALGLTRGIGYQSTSDFPILLGNVVDRKLRAAYTELPSQWREFATKSDAVDFREKSSVRIDGMVGEFEKVVEGGEYKYDSSAESGESWKVDKYGKIIAVTWETLINDDLGAFNRIPMAIAQRAKQKQDNIIWDIFLKNQKMSDGKNLFDSTHGNLAATGTDLTIESLQAARKAFRSRKVNNTFINITPTFLIVGPELELQAYQLTSSAYTPVTAGTINPVYNTQLIVIVEPRITDKSWYLSARPGMIDTIEYGFLQGEGELFTERRVGFDVDGLEIKARMVFGAKAVDYKGFYKNPGL